MCCSRQFISTFETFVVDNDVFVFVLEDSPFKLESVFGRTGQHWGLNI